MKRLLVMLAAAVAIGGLALTVPALASADTADTATTTNDTGAMTAEDCVKYLQGQGYVIGPKVKDACKTGTADPTSCHKKLTTIGVNSEHAKKACKHAAS